MLSLQNLLYGGKKRANLGNFVSLDNLWTSEFLTSTVNHIPRKLCRGVMVDRGPTTNQDSILLDFITVCTTDLGQRRDYKCSHW